MSSKPKRLILFGAGGSYGCGSVLPEAPPLGGNLYGELKRLLPSWSNLPSEIDSAFNRSFEDGMQVLWDKYSMAIPELMRHMTLYFAQFRISNSNNLYQQFIAGISKEASKYNYLVGSLNYEMLLEIAANNSGLRVDYFAEDSSQSSLPVWKLHGSCNFIPEGIQAGGGVHFGSGVVFNTGIKAVSPNEAIEFCLSGTGLYPAMALYMKSKPVQIGQSAIKAQQESWGKKVSEAEKVLVIGVRPYFADEYIWKPLTETKGSVAYIGSKKEYEEWIKSGRDSGSTEFIASRWDQGFDNAMDFIRR